MAADRARTDPTAHGRRRRRGGGAAGRSSRRVGCRNPASRWSASPKVTSRPRPHRSATRSTAPRSCRRRSCRRAPSCGGCRCSRRRSTSRIAAGDIDRAAIGCRRAGGRRRPLPEQGTRRLCRSHGARVRLAEGDAVEAERLFSEGARPGATSVRPTRRRLARLGLADAHRGRRQGAPSRARAPGGPSDARPDRVEASTAAPLETTIEVRTTVRGAERVPSRGGLLVVGVRRAHRAGARPQGHAIPRPAPRRTRRGSSTCSTSSRPRRPGSCWPSAGPRGAAPTSGMPARCSTRDAKEAYRRRLAEIEEDIEDARASGDEIREAQADARTRLPRPRAVASRWSRWPRTTSRRRIGASAGRGDTRGSPGDGSDRRAAPRARRAPRPDHPHRHLLLLPA